MNRWRWLGSLFGHVVVAHRDGRPTLTACGLNGAPITQKTAAVTCEKCRAAIK